MNRTLVLATLSAMFVACREKPKPLPKPAPQVDPDQSRGFLPTKYPLPPPAPGELEKIARLKASPRPAADFVRPRDADPEGNPILDVYVDEKIKLKVHVADLKQPMPVDAIAKKVRVQPRIIEASSDDGVLWIKPADVSEFHVRLNRRGEMKLEGAKQKRGKSGKKERPPAPHQARELRNVSWLEIRTTSSPKLPNEPR